MTSLNLSHAITHLCSCHFALLDVPFGAYGEVVMVLVILIQILMVEMMLSVLVAIYYDRKGLIINIISRKNLLMKLFIFLKKIAMVMNYYGS